MTTPCSTRDCARRRIARRSSSRVRTGSVWQATARSGLMASLRYDTPTSPAAIAVLIPTRGPQGQRSASRERSIEIEASYGLHGARLGSGPARGRIARRALRRRAGNVTRTGRPTRGTTNSTRRRRGRRVFLSVRMTLGVAHRVAGPRPAAPSSPGTGIQVLLMVRRA
jgi:hypothetical protein